MRSLTVGLLIFISVEYIFLILENALRNVSMVFRSHPEWNVVEPIRNVGKSISFCVLTKFENVLT